MTPRRESGFEIDLAAGLEMVDFLNSQPVDGLALLGATGEFVHFDSADRKKFVAMAARRSAKPVVVNASHSTYPGAYALACEALMAGARAVLLMPPYFFRYSQEAVVCFYERLARDRVAPVLLYNLPGFTTPVTAETASGLLRSGAVAGIKDSSGDPALLEALLAARASSNACILVGNDRLLAYGQRHGADGVISGVAGMMPELIAALWSAAAADGSERHATLLRLLEECLDWLDQFPVPMGIKMAVNFRRLPAGPTAVPSSNREAQQFQVFERWFYDWRRRVEALVSAV